MTSNRDFYLFVDDYDRALVDEELLSGYSEGMTFQEKVELVTERVKGCAKYNIEAAAPPADNTFLEYFLLDSKEGYCLHFATAATLAFPVAAVYRRGS